MARKRKSRAKELWVPADRLLAVTSLHRNPSGALQGHNCERTYRAVKAGTRKFISLRAADSILTFLDLNHYWHLPQDQGGLADIYEDGKQYGQPDNTHKCVSPHPTTVRYQTNQEREEARRRTWREYKQRQKEAA